MQRRSGTTSRSRSKTGPSTRERILESSLELFNRRGVRDVPLTMIASHVGISPGNLGYHFKTKTDIVIAMFPALAERMRQVKKPDGPFDPRSAALNWIEVFATLWQYRYFFNGLLQLLGEDRALLKRYLELEDHVITTLGSIFDELIRQGYMKAPTAPITTAILARNCWLIWLSWLRFEQLDHPTGVNARPAAIYDGVLHNFCLIQLYFDPQFGEAILAEARIALAVGLPSTDRASSTGAPSRPPPGRDGSGGAPTVAACAPNDRSSE